VQQVAAGPAIASSTRRRQDTRSASTVWLTRRVPPGVRVHLGSRHSCRQMSRQMVRASELARAISSASVRPRKVQPVARSARHWRSASGRGTACRSPGPDADRMVREDWQHGRHRPSAHRVPESSRARKSACWSRQGDRTAIKSTWAELGDAGAHVGSPPRTQDGDAMASVLNERRS
jgi:hypothetical protein